MSRIVHRGGNKIKYLEQIYKASGNFLKLNLGFAKGQNHFKSLEHVSVTNMKWGLKFYLKLRRCIPKAEEVLKS